MKILNYSTWYLLFTTIIQVVSGYTCPNITEINKKIDAKQPMRFPLTEGEHPFWGYKDFNNRMGKFYNGTGKATEIAAIYYQEPLKKVRSSLTCIYKDSQSRFFALVATKKRVNAVNSSSIINDENWSPFYREGIYACGDDYQPKKSIDMCQFSLKASH
ncbi:MAG: hypothetical protein WA659_06930 [Candidatus Aquirickettsiella sp.]